MSLETWKQEFYPVPADQCPKTAADAIAHSIKKWEGLKESNLERHEVEKRGMCIQDVYAAGRQRLRIDFTSCALCVQYEGASEDCKTCPLAVARGGTRCDLDTHQEMVDGVSCPWDAWSVNNDPDPMLTWLRKAADQNTPI